MAGEIDFRLLSPTGPADIAQSYGRGQQEAQANLLAQQQLQSAQNQNALAKYQIDAARMQNEQQNALNAKYATGAFDPMSNESHLKELYGMGAPGRAQAGEILKFRADQRKAEESAFNVAAKRHDVYKQEMGVLATEPNLTKDMVVSTFDNLVANGLMPQATRDAMVAKLPDDSAALRASALQDAKAGLKGKELLTAFLPEPMIAGGDIINKNPLAPGGVGKVLGRVAMSEAQIAQNKIAQRNADIAAGRLGVEQKRESRLSQGPVGTSLTPEQNDALFGENGAVAMGKLNPNKINSRNAKMWAEAFVRNPNADPARIAQDISTADKAIKDFGTGEQGKKVTAFNTAIDHLDTLDKLGAALKGGDVKLFNSIANTLGVQTGQSAATMYNQAARIVGGEISKAIVPGVGTGKEREETSNAFNSAMSPEQLAGASATAKKLLGGQLGSLELQYKRTTKRNDFGDQFLSPAARSVYQTNRGTSINSAAPSATQSGATVSNW